MSRFLREVPRDCKKIAECCFNEALREMENITHLRQLFDQRIEALASLDATAMDELKRRVNELVKKLNKLGKNPKPVEENEIGIEVIRRRLFNCVDFLSDPPVPKETVDKSAQPNLYLVPCEIIDWTDGPSDEPTEIEKPLSELLPNYGLEIELVSDNFFDICALQYWGDKSYGRQMHELILHALHAELFVSREHGEKVRTAFNVSTRDFFFIEKPPFVIFRFFFSRQTHMIFRTLTLTSTSTISSMSCPVTTRRSPQTSLPLRILSSILSVRFSLMVSLQYGRKAKGRSGLNIPTRTEKNSTDYTKSEFWTEPAGKSTFRVFFFFSFSGPFDCIFFLFLLFDLASSLFGVFFLLLHFQVADFFFFSRARTHVLGFGPPSSP